MDNSPVPPDSFTNALSSSSDSQTSSGTSSVGSETSLPDLSTPEGFILNKQLLSLLDSAVPSKFKQLKGYQEWGKPDSLVKTLKKAVELKLLPENRWYSDASNQEGLPTPVFLFWPRSEAETTCSCADPDQLERSDNSEHIIFERWNTSTNSNDTRRWEHVAAIGLTLPQDDREASASETIKKYLNDAGKTAGRRAVFGFSLVGERLHVYLNSPSGFFVSPTVTCGRRQADWDAPLRLFDKLASMSERELGALLFIKDDITSEVYEHQWITLASSTLPSLVFASSDWFRCNPTDLHLYKHLHESHRTMKEGVKYVYLAEMGLSNGDFSREAVVRTSFPEVDAAAKEIEVLAAIATEKCKSVEGLPKVLAIFKGEPSKGFGPFVGKGCKERVPLLIVMEEEFEPLKTVTNGEDLICVTKEVIHIHKCLFNLGWLHRDISLGNVMLGRDGRARLNDLDLAMKAQGLKCQAPGHHVGTTAFKARDLLHLRNTTHTVGHDMESLLWTILFLVLQYYPGGNSGFVPNPHAIHFVKRIKGPSRVDSLTFKRGLEKEDEWNQLMRGVDQEWGEEICVFLKQFAKLLGLARSSVERGAVDIAQLSHEQVMAALM